MVGRAVVLTLFANVEAGSTGTKPGAQCARVPVEVESPHAVDALTYYEISGMIETREGSTTNTRIYVYPDFKNQFMKDFAKLIHEWEKAKQV